MWIFLALVIVYSILPRRNQTDTENTKEPEACVNSQRLWQQEKALPRIKSNKIPALRRGRWYEAVYSASSNFSFHKRKVTIMVVFTLWDCGDLAQKVLEHDWQLARLYQFRWCWSWRFPSWYMGYLPRSTSDIWTSVMDITWVYTAYSHKSLVTLGIHHKLLQNEIACNDFSDTNKLRYVGMSFVIVTFPKVKFSNFICRVAHRCKTNSIPQQQLLPL